MIFEHTHAVWEWYLQQHGVTPWHGGGGSWTLEPGDLLGVAPGVRHAMGSETTASVHFYFAAVDLGTVLTRQPALAASWSTLPTAVHHPHSQALTYPFEQLVQELTAR
ncbi:MAG: AraC family ligand binding domain-containing protein [Propionibacteriaceae bacterium]